MDILHVWQVLWHMQGHMAKIQNTHALALRMHGLHDQYTCSEQGPHENQSKHLMGAGSFSFSLVMNLADVPATPQPWLLDLRAILNATAMGINQKAAKALTRLQPYSAEPSPKDMLIHPSNRGGRMCNHFGVMSKGQQICEVGWDLKEVRESVCVELPVHSQKRLDAINCNVALAANSAGMLAKRFGKERYCSLSTSHTIAFLTALEAGCKI